mgnify:CR=1 FL=1
MFHMVHEISMVGSRQLAPLQGAHITTTRMTNPSSMEPQQCHVEPRTEMSAISINQKRFPKTWCSLQNKQALS